ncbi:zinc ribbon family protein [Glaciihabitans tibetensis]|uniref:Zinc ribbon family protein n=1 Tax=Glaciihabitans tibetensis TaxID=1266600 RepID=A0A2T0VCY2_9MICO|nr:zinc-ribbon domain-containing protein [Glaciihabitans tibetensis]PRY68033.1 zinc ribbon family protein [Glaciihabitans tibetensis]
MFLLFGARTAEALINVVTFVCGYCGVRAEQQVVKRATKFTLFFVPLFTVSSSYSNTCTHCGGTTNLTKNQAKHSLEWTQANKAAQP